MSSNGDTYRVRGVTTARELASANGLLARTQLPPYDESMRWLKRTGPHWPGFKLEHTRVAYAGGEPVGGLRILTLTLRIGAARLKCGGIGWVSTSPAHRNRGVCRALMTDAHDYMRRNGYHLSLLFGVPGLYQKFGYVTAIPTHTVVVDATVQPIEAGSWRVRRIRPADRTRLYAIHTANMKDAPCAIERSAAYFKTLFDCTAHTVPFPPGWCESMMVQGDRGRIAGYFMPQRGNGELHVTELGVVQRADRDAVLGAALDFARNGKYARVRFHVPPWHVFARRLREYESIHETQFYRHREGMIAVIDRDATIARMAPEWERLLRNAGTISGARSDGKPMGLPASITDQDLCRLLVGFTSGEEWLRDNGTRMSPRKRAAFESMFPCRDPFVWPIDHF